MVHSIELLFDHDTEAAIRRIWDDLAAADIPSQAPVGRPHVTLAVADRIADDVDDLLGPVAGQLPLGCAVGASLLLGSANAILARLIVPTAALLAMHADVHRICGAHLEPEAALNSLPGHWTPHVTLARRVDGSALAQALRIAGRPSLIEGRFAGLRHWNGDKRVEHPIG
jgi:hypothetical protein